MCLTALENQQPQLSRNGKLCSTIRHKHILERLATLLSPTTNSPNANYTYLVVSKCICLNIYMPYVLTNTPLLVLLPRIQKKAKSHLIGLIRHHPVSIYEPVVLH